MRRLLLVIFLTLSACVTPPAAEPSETRLPTVFDNGLVYVRVSVNGAPEVWMLLDNGTTPSAIDFGYAKTLGLPLKPAAGLGTGIGSGTFQFSNTSADLAAGSTQRHMAFSALDLHTVKGPGGQPLAGVLGYSFLAGRIIVIDYPHQTLSLVRSLAPCSCDIASKLDTDIPAVPITVAGHRLTALIDTGGAYDLLLTPAAVKAAGLEADEAAATSDTGYGYAGPQSVKVGTAPDVTVGAIVKSRPRALFATFGSSPLKAQAALGSEFLKAYKVTLNYRAHTARIEP